MADLEKIVKIIFAGDDSDLARTINSVGGGMDKLALNVGKATQPLADLTDSILKIDAVLAGLAAGALVVVTTQAGKFGDSFAEIATLIEAPAGALLEFKDDILDYSRDSTSSLESITGATYQIISATGDWENALETLSAAERLNVAGKGELDSTTKLLVTSLNAYGQGVEGAADFSDILFTTVRVGVTNLTELSASLGTVTGLASSAGVPFVDLNAAVGALTGTVGDTSLAVTQIKGILTAIIKPSAQAADAAEELGIQFNTQALAAMGLEKFLQMVYEATDGNTTVMARLFGRVEGLNGALVLGADTSGKYAEALRGMEERAGATDAAYAKMADNFALANQKLINNLQATLIEAGLPLLDEWGAIVDSIVNIFQGVSVGFDEGSFDPLIQYIEKVGQSIATEFEGIAEALPEALAGIDWSEFTQSLDGLVAAGKNLFIELFGDLDLTKPEDLERALQKVIDTFEKWVDLTSGVVSGLAPFLGMLADLGSKFSELDGETLDLTGKILGWGKAINVVAGVIPGLTAPLSLLSASIGLLSITQIPKFVSSLLPLTAGLGSLTLAFVPFVALMATFEALTPDTGLGKWLRENSTLFKSFAETVDSVVLALGGYDQKQIDVIESEAAHTLSMGKMAVEVVKLIEKIEGVPEQKTVTIDTELTGFFAEVDLEEWKLQNLTGYEIKVTADTTQAQEELEKVSNWNTLILEDGTEISIPVTIDSSATAESAAEAKAKIDEVLPTEKLMEIKLQGDIDIELQRIKTTAESLQAAFEWDAKIEIAAIEADARRIEAIAESISVAWESTGDVISAAFGILADPNLAFGDYRTIIRLIETESDRRSELLIMQKELTEAEIAHIKARTDAITKGQGIITISADGIEPELEMVLQKIIKLAQIQANEEGFEMLLGI